MTKQESVRMRGGFGTGSLPGMASVGAEALLPLGPVALPGLPPAHEGLGLQGLRSPLMLEPTDPQDDQGWHRWLCSSEERRASGHQLM